VSWIDGITETRPCPGGPATAIAFRPTLVQKLQYGLFVAVVVSAENVVISGVHGAFWPGPLIFASMFTASSLLPTTAGTVITEEVVTVRKFSRRTIRWCDVESVSRERRFGGARFVLLHETGGRKTRLQGLLSGPLAWDPAFDAKYETVTHWWAAARREGSNSQPIA
jgi:hypothetical protein